MAREAKGPRTRPAGWSDQALRALVDGGHRPGAATRSVVDQLAREDCCLSASELGERVRAGGGRAGIASVYRALDLLRRAGLVQRVEVGDGGARYEASVPGGDHHHHVVCDRCGRITPFEDPGLEQAIDRLAGRLHHRVSAHEVVIRGRCPRCADGA